MPVAHITKCLNSVSSREKINAQKLVYFTLTAYHE